MRDLNKTFRKKHPQQTYVEFIQLTFMLRQLSPPGAYALELVEWKKRLGFRFAA